MKLLTNLLFEPKGKHDPANEYKVKDTVMSPDGSQVYFALKDVPAGIPLDNTEYWILQIDLHDTKAAMDAAAAAAAGAVSANVDQNLTETQKATARRNIGMDKVIESLSDPLEASGNPLVVNPVGGLPFDSVVTVLEPKQSGSGDPYPAGGGKNLAKMVYAADGVIVENADGSVTVTNQASHEIGGAECVLTGIIPAGTYTVNIFNSQVSAVYLQITGASDYTKMLLLNTPYTFDYDGVSYLRIKCGNIAIGASNTYKIQLEAGSTATEFQPYSNIRPITGWDAVELNHAGKNLLPNNATTQTINGVTFTINADGSVTANGTASEDARLILAQTGAAIYPPGSYIVTGCPTGGDSDKYMIGAYFDVDGVTMWDGEFGYGKIYTALHTMQTHNTCIIIKAGYTASNLTFRPMLRLASDLDATYAPYAGTLHTVQIGQTVYGGRMDWLTGKLVAEWYGKTFDGTEAWEKSEAGALGFRLMEQAADNMCICSHFKYELSHGGSGCYIGGTGTIFYIGSAWSTGYSIDEFKAFLAAQYAAGTPVQVAYELAEPFEIQLTPTEIIALQGVNTLYGDGTITVTGRQPKTNALESRLAAIEAAMTNV